MVCEAWVFISEYLDVPLPLPTSPFYLELHPQRPMICDGWDSCLLHTPSLGHSFTPSKPHCSPSPFHFLKGRDLDASSPLQSLTVPFSVHSPLGPDASSPLQDVAGSPRSLLFQPTSHFRRLLTKSSLSTSATHARGPRSSVVNLRRSRRAASFKGGHLVTFPPFSCNTKEIFNQITHTIPCLPSDS